MVARRVLRVAVLAAALLGTGTANSWALVNHRAHHQSAAHHSFTSRRPCTNARLMPNNKDLKLIRAATLCLINRERTRRGEHSLRPNARLRR